MAAGPDEGLLGIRDDFRIRELDQPAIMFKEFIGIQGWKALRVEEQILFYFIAHNFREHKREEPRRA
jgi:hypothetical protein